MFGYPDETLFLVLDVLLPVEKSCDSYARVILKFLKIFNWILKRLRPQTLIALVVFINACSRRKDAILITYLYNLFIIYFEWQSCTIYYIFFCFKILSAHGSWSQNILYSLASDKWQVTWVWFSFYAFSGFLRWSENKWPVRVVREELFYEYFSIGSSWNSLLLKALSRNEFLRRDDLNMGCNATCCGYNLLKQMFTSTLTLWE